MGQGRLTLVTNEEVPPLKISGLAQIVSASSIFYKTCLLQVVQHKRKLSGRPIINKNNVGVC